MKLITGLLLCVGGLLLTPSLSQTGGWRGIVPLHSTRADVERLIGKPNFRHDWYNFEDERASIMYSREPCTGGLQGSYNVPRDTVISIDVAPKGKLILSGLNLDPSKYKKLEGAPGIDLASYRSEEEGVTYVAYKGGDSDGEIRVIIYGPRAGDAHLRCPAPPGQADADHGSSAKSADGGTGPLGECPTISIVGPPGETSQTGEYALSAHISGTDPRFTATLKWGVSAGVIVSGQGTSTVKIDAGAAGRQSVTVTLEVGGVIPKGCSMVATYTIEYPKP